MSTADSWKLLVFRDGRRVLSGRELLQVLHQQIESVQNFSDFNSTLARDELIDALLRAGELECALADWKGCEAEAGLLECITDDLAVALAKKSRPRVQAKLLQHLQTLTLPEKLTLSTPEGFCYYALHPLDYVDLLNKNAIDLCAAAVIGIRSIGTTLSAVVRSWFLSKEIPAERITVRPTGHPFDRRLLLDSGLRCWIETHLRRNARFLIVDEGPGLSGSSFLSVAEALVEAGVPSSHILLLPSSTPDLPKLLAQNAAARWSRFRTLPLKPTSRIPSEAVEFIGGGEWRKHVFASETEWPGVWSWTERQKYFSRDLRNIFRFDGHGYYGKDVRHRSQILAEHGWGPEVSSAGDGFSVSPWLEGTRLRHADQKLIRQLARYCAFRTEHLRCNPVSHADLEHMTEVNLDRGVGIKCRIELPLEHPVIADARMMPHEWILARNGQLLKFDAASHGDDHFYPGPTDIAWDLAGAIVEWNLDKEAAEVLVREYAYISGDKVVDRLPGYLLAYSAFRLGFCESTKNSQVGQLDFSILERESKMYLRRISQLLSKPAVTALS